MIKVFEAEDLLVTLQTDCVTDTELIPIVADVVVRQQNGEKLVTKIRYTKSASFLNVYKYDKTSWRYLLESSTEIQLGR